MRIFVCLCAVLCGLVVQTTNAKEWENKPALRIRIMDKVTAQTQIYQLNVDRTVAFGSLRIRPKTCRETGALDEPESSAFLQIWEVAAETNATPKPQDKWLFSGWMFASSPSLSALDHPVYDLWLLGCVDPDAKPVVEEPAATDKTNEPDPSTKDTGADTATESLD